MKVRMVLSAYTGLGTPLSLGPVSGSASGTHA